MCWVFLGGFMWILLLFTYSPPFEGIANRQFNGRYDLPRCFFQASKTAQKNPPSVAVLVDALVCPDVGGDVG